MKLTKQEFLFWVLLAVSHVALIFLHRLLEETIEPKLAFILFTSVYGFALMTFSLLYRNGKLNYPIFNNEEKYRRKSSNLAIFFLLLIILMVFLVYFLPYNQARIICDILIILAGTMILIFNWKDRTG